jgi:hypothetical protein
MSLPSFPPPAIWFQYKNDSPVSLYVHTLKRDDCFTAGDLRDKVKAKLTPRLDTVSVGNIRLQYHNGTPVEEDTLVDSLINDRTTALVVHVDTPETSSQASPSLKEGLKALEEKIEKLTLTINTKVSTYATVCKSSHLYQRAVH